MRSSHHRGVCAWFLGTMLLLLPSTTSTTTQAADVPPATDPGPNQKDEPLAQKFALERSIQFLDDASLSWQKQRNCFTCHTNYAYLYARPFSDPGAAALAHRAIRQAAEELVTTRWEKQGPRWDAEVVATAAALAFNDAHTTKTLHPVTRTALDRMWTLQRPDGGWNWLKCDWPPMESDDDYGVAVAALAVGVAPAEYAQSPQARKGVESIRRYLKSNPPPTLHHKAMLLWAQSLGVEGLLSQQHKAEAVDALLQLQKPDGGWALATLGNWKREDGSAQDLESSDGYATGFVLYVLRRSGIAADDPRIKRGVQWLTSHQRGSGRWFTRSLHKDSKHFITHAGTAFAVMALAECGQTTAGAGTGARSSP